MTLSARISRAALGCALGAVVSSGLLIVDLDPAAASPAAPPPPATINGLPGVPLPSIPPPSISPPSISPPSISLPSIRPAVPLPTTVPSTVPGVGDVVSSVHGLGGTVQHATNEALKPPAATGLDRPAGVAPTSVPRDNGRVSSAGPRPRALATTSDTRRDTGKPSTLKQRPATGRPGAATVLASGSGVARTGVAVAAAPALARDPVTLVRQAVHAVLHPGRALLALIAITAVCALGILAFVTSLGRRPTESC